MERREMKPNFVEHLVESRRELMADLPRLERSSDAAEGGCGVLGFAANVPIAGRHVLTASRQMHNRGNGKGGGIAMAGLDPAQMRVDAETLRTHYLLQIAVLDPAAREEVEREFIRPHFDVAQAYEIDRVDDYHAIAGLEIRPPDVWRYFVRVKPAVLERFAGEKGLEVGSWKLEVGGWRAVEDEFVYQNSFRLNTKFYASLGDKRAFVLCHGRDLIVLKIVGYAEQVAEYYRLQDQTARVWIAHQRYPTKGRVWHPGGAHPFIGLNEALVHNGDFANYHAVSEYLRQRNIGQLFLTDTEVSVQLFDLWDRVYRYPLEVTLEAMAPTTEFDFVMLPPDKQELYRAVQAAHIHGSPDGPWFFIIARSKPDEGVSELIGITDTSMLRPQVFALYENTPPLAPAREQGGMAGGVKIGLIASERQAINACLRSLSVEDDRFQPVADKYWVARGGSYTDGGSFRFAVSREGEFSCANKFGAAVTVEAGRRHVDRARLHAADASGDFKREVERRALHAVDDGGSATLFDWMRRALRAADWDEVAYLVEWLRDFAGKGDAERAFALDALTLLHDRRFDPGDKKRASLLALVEESVGAILRGAPRLDERAGEPASQRRLAWDNRAALRPPEAGEVTLVLDVRGFPPEGEECAARWIVRAAEMGWRRFITFGWHGGRFAACGLGPRSDGIRIDLYGDVGDYAASGLDGAEVHIHGDAQDQVGQILKSGKVVIHGDVGQTFLYGAKGGEIYVLGSAAGRPLINAVGKPRAVINGTCLDYLAESFMAGDPHNGGGFVVLNGVTFDEAGRLIELESPYPGGNLFSLASGGAIYVRDPHGKVQGDQLNGGQFAELSGADWRLIEPYLRENERLFGIGVDDLLTVDGRRRRPHEVYRKVEVRGLGVLKETENR
jgi:glutamate synthase domain-containing protein 1